MTKWAVRYERGLRRRSGSKARWKFVAFEGPRGSESRGIVDLLAIRKDHRRQAAPLKRGDLFDIVLMQIKGGASPRPSASDVRRLRAVARRYRAREIVLAEWVKGRRPRFYKLTRRSQEPWESVESAEVFA